MLKGPPAGQILKRTYTLKGHICSQPTKCIVDPGGSAAHIFIVAASDHGPAMQMRGRAKSTCTTLNYAICIHMVQARHIGPISYGWMYVSNPHRPIGPRHRLCASLQSMKLRKWQTYRYVRYCSGRSLSIAKIPASKTLYLGSRSGTLRQEERHAPGSHVRVLALLSQSDSIAKHRLHIHQGLRESDKVLVFEA